MRRWLTLLLLVGLPAVAAAQPVQPCYFCLSRSGSAPGSLDPAQLTDPTGGLTIGGIVGAATISPNFAVIPIFSSGTGAVPATGDVGTFYFETDSNRFYTYPSTDTEHWVPSIAPAAIAHGDVFFVDTNLNLARLGAGTSGYFLKTNGAGADPAWAAAGTVDPLTTISATEEFLRGLNTTGNIGTLGWAFTLISTGASIAFVNGTPEHWGIQRITTGATDNAGAFIFISGMTNPATAEFDMTWLFRPVDAVTSTYLSVGLTVGTPTAATSAIRAVYDTDLSHATWIFQICNSDTAGCQSAGDDTASKTVASANAPIANTWQKFRLRRVASGVGGNPTIYMSIGTGGAVETEKTFCSSGCDDTLDTLPTGDLVPTIAIVARAATTSKDLDVDMFTATITGLTRF